MMVDTPHVRKFMRFLGACFFFWWLIWTTYFSFLLGMVFCTSKSGISLAGGLAYLVLPPPHKWAEDRHILGMFWMGWNDQADELWVLSIAVSSGFLYAHTFVYVYGLYRCVSHRISIYSWTVLVVYFFVQRSEFPWDSTVYIYIHMIFIYIYIYDYICIYTCHVCVYYMHML